MPSPFVALMCHAPIVIPDVAGAEATCCRRTTRAMREVATRAAAAEVDRLVVVSPHSPRRRAAFSAWYGRHQGDLRQFRAAHLAVDLPDAPEVAERLRLAPVHGGALDHGAMVPLLFLWRAGWRGPTSILALPWEEGTELPIGEALAALPGRTAVIASGDMSHRLQPGAPGGFHPHAHEFDEAFVTALGVRQWSGLTHLRRREDAGEDVVASTEVAIGAAGAPRNAEVLAYEAPWGVGYTEAILADDRPPLYAIARSAIRAGLRGLPWDGPVGGPPAGVFVTLRERNGDLRGCIGTTAPTTGSLYEETARLALCAATEDTRFEPVRAEEVDDLRIEVSVLEPPEPVTDRASLDPRRWGLIVRSGGRQGLLLPDLDGVDTVDQQIDICRRKGGIAPGAPVELRRFTVRKEEMPDDPLDPN